MSNGHRWSKFWWQDWQNDTSLRRCSIGARGLWMELLCIAHEGEPYGHLKLNGQPLAAADFVGMIATITLKEVVRLLAELEGKGVFSRTEDGTIYCRRMVKDHDRSEEGRENISKRWKGNGALHPNRGATRSPTNKPSRDPTRHPITLEAESESEAEAPPISPPFRGGRRRRVEIPRFRNGWLQLIRDEGMPSQDGKPDEENSIIAALQRLSAA